VVCKPEELAEVKADPVVKTIAELQKGFPGDIEIDKLYQPTKRSFTDRVKSFHPHVLHFIGHGKYDKHNKLGGGSLAFVQEGDQKTATWIGDLDLADSFQDFQPRLIFLHACEGATSESYEGFRGVALQLVYSKVPAVVAMQYPIKNKVAIEFAKKFYQCLGEGKPIDVAVQEGRLELGMYLDERNFSSRAFGSPVVYLQSAEGIIIAEAQDEPKTQLQPPSTSFKVTCPYPDCTGMVIPSRRFCPACRRPLMRCPECDEVMAKDLEFCDNCGYNRESKAYHIEVTTVKRKADPFQVSRIDRQRPRM
ncbi:MAG: CHAT domain-containing protein, partial [Candidatus Hodarchaeota archaeon]